MPKLKDVCVNVRSKNAGPFWITADLFFRDAEVYQAYKSDAALSASSLAGLLGVVTEHVRVIEVPNLHIVKITYPRTSPQGWADERDMHGGQQYVDLLMLELGKA
jgi:hypothetical protein